MIYLDNASTTNIAPAIANTYQTLLATYFANPSGNHKLARDVDRLQERARDEILKIFNYTAGKVIFTSGGTEANNLALIGLFLQYQNRGNEIIISAFEHPSVKESALYLAKYHGAVIKEIGLTNYGSLDFVALEQALSSNTVLVSIMGVNNEIGTVIDLAKIKELLGNYPKVIFHSDLTQSVGKVIVNYDLVDAFTYSAHKIHGLKGSGALVLRKKLNVIPIFHGGNQEDGIRPGTSNSPANIVLAKTTRLAFLNQKDGFSKVLVLAQALNEYLEKYPEHFIIHSTLENPFIINFSLVQKRASIILNALENENIYIGTTSSCSAKLHEPSRSVLALTNNSDYALNALRVSLSGANTHKEITVVCRLLDKYVRGVVI